jgi:Sec-independent protein translocase protein TatA
MPDLLLVLIVILVLVVMWRGPKTLPKLGEALGRGVREARKEASSLTDEHRPAGEKGPEDRRD